MSLEELKHAEAQSTLDQPDALRRGSYCEVYVCHDWNHMTMASGWKAGIIVSVGPKRTRVAVGGKQITKRNCHVRAII